MDLRKSATVIPFIGIALLVVILSLTRFESGSSAVPLELKQPPEDRYVAKTVSAEIRLWKLFKDSVGRRAGGCYLSVRTSEWETFFIDVSGPVCDSAATPSSIQLNPQ